MDPTIKLKSWEITYNFTLIYLKIWMIRPIPWKVLLPKNDSESLNNFVFIEDVESVI